MWEHIFITLKCARSEHVPNLEAIKEKTDKLRHIKKYMFLWQNTL